MFLDAQVLKRNRDIKVTIYIRDLGILTRDLEDTIYIKIRCVLEVTIQDEKN